jgi:transposase-like protein
MTNMLHCSQCGAVVEAPCDCRAPFIYMSAGKAAAEAIKRNPEKSDRAIAAEIGIGPETVRRARISTASNGAVEKRVGRDGRQRKMPIKPEMRQHIPADIKDAVAKLVLEGGMSVEAAAKEKGVSATVVIKAVQRARGRHEERERLKAEAVAVQAVAQADRDEESLPKSSKDKLAAAIRRRTRELEGEFADRVRKEVERRFDEMILPAWQEQVRRSEDIENSHKGIFSKAEFNTIMRCLHPDLQPTPEQKKQATQIINEHKHVLVKTDTAKSYLSEIEEFIRRRETYKAQKAADRAAKQWFEQNRPE